MISCDLRLGPAEGVRTGWVLLAGPEGNEFDVEISVGGLDAE